MFSIVVPVYNGEKYLAECLNSVGAQTFTDYELIIVDDGSTDNSGTIADEYGLIHSNTTVLHGPNQGLLLARRRGLSHCRGEFVVFLDSDDVLRNDALDILAIAIEETGVDIVSFRFSRCSDFSTKDDLSFLNEGIYREDNYGLFKRAVCAGLSNSLCGKAIRLCHIDVESAYGAYARLMLAEDLLQLLPIVDSARSFSRVEDVLYYYRPSETSSTASFKHSYIDNTERVALRLLEYGNSWGYGEDALDGALRLYVSLAKMLSDSVSNMGLSVAKEELEEMRESLISLTSNVKDGIKRMRKDQQVILNAVLNENLVSLRMITGASHAGRKLLGRSI